MAEFASSHHKQLISKTKEVHDRGNSDKRKYFSEIYFKRSEIDPRGQVGKDK